MPSFVTLFHRLRLCPVKLKGGEMTNEIKNRIIEVMGEIGGLIESYSADTSEILTTDIDETLEDIIARREKTLAEIGEKRAEIDRLREECTPEESGVIHKIITNGHIPLGISRELREIHKAAVKMRSVYISAAEKDKQAALRVDARVKELRTQLEALQDDKKKIDFYSNNKLTDNKGGSFDSHL